MKRFNVLVMIVMVFFSCKGQNTENALKTAEKGNKVFTSFGNQIDAEDTKDAEQMFLKYKSLIAKDTLATKFTATVKDVCQAKGCWMTLELPDGQEAMVRFKDYGFFIPKDISGQEVIVNGLAFVEEMSVADQKHYAKDGGSSTEEINKITQPKRTYGFEADGVLLKR